MFILKKEDDKRFFRVPKNPVVIYLTSFITLLAAIIMALFFYFVDLIPDLELDLNRAEIYKLDLVGEIKLHRVGIFDIECRRNIGQYGYKIFISNTGDDGEFSGTSCDDRFMFVDCPDLRVVEEDGKFLVKTFFYTKEKYSVDEVLNCAHLVVDDAPSKFEFSKEFMDNKKKNSNLDSYKQLVN